MSKNSTVSTEPTWESTLPLLYGTPKMELYEATFGNGNSGNLTETTLHHLVCDDNQNFLHQISSYLPQSVDLCLIDPPYNTGNSHKTGFTYHDMFPTRQNWLDFMKTRLAPTRELLKDTGVLAIHIDDNEVHWLRVLCDEIFGEKNFIAQIIIDGGALKNNARFVSSTHEYLILYAKDKKKMQEAGIKWRTERKGVDLLFAEYERLKTLHGLYAYNDISAGLKKWAKTAPISKRLKVFTSVDEQGIYTYADLSAPTRTQHTYQVLHPKTGKPCSEPSRGWGVSQERMQELLDTDMIIFGENETYQPLRKLYLTKERNQVVRSILHYPARSSTHLLVKMLGERNMFNNPKNLTLVEDLVNIMCPEGGVVLDYFAGSGTVGHAVLTTNATLPDSSHRKFILVNSNENNIFFTVTLPRIQAAVTGEWAGGETHTSLPGRVRVWEQEH